MKIDIQKYCLHHKQDLAVGKVINVYKLRQFRGIKNKSGSDF